MYFLLLGIAFIALKLLEIGPVARWGWDWVLAPFALTLVWWWIADKTGYTRRQVEKAEEKRKQDRLDAERQRLGLGSAPKSK